MRLYLIGVSFSNTCCHTVLYLFIYLVAKGQTAKLINPQTIDYLFLNHKNLDFHVGGRSFFILKKILQIKLFITYKG